MNKFDSQLKKIFDSVNRKIDNAPLLITETALEHFQNALIDKKWDGRPYEAYKNKKREPSRGSLMTRNFNLFRSLRINFVTSDSSRISAGNSKVPYARVHNEGLTVHHRPRTTIVTHKEHTAGKYKGKTLFARNNGNATYSQKASVGAYSVKMPERRFMGKSASLIREIKTRFKNNLKNL
ncbi:phage virion morphogenesis protein [Sphingobacterium sp. LRF_L2]|uniref:phage virion morphogenesis protein n=1 Tax=Sphingobacterium sp. LRF_L2 TaxID=3369421 RepID=UPI003F5EE617